MRHSSIVLASCLVTSLIVGFSGAVLAQGTSAPATTTTATTTTKKHHHCCRLKKWCHKHHHKKGTTGTTPAPTTPAQ